MSKYKVIYTDNIYRDNELEHERFAKLGEFEEIAHAVLD